MRDDCCEVERLTVCLLLCLIVCREMGNPRTMNDIATALAIKRKDVSRNYTVLIFELNIKAPLIDPLKCIVKVANKLNISEKTKHTAINIMTDAVKLKITAGKMLWVWQQQYFIYHV